MSDIKTVKTETRTLVDVDSGEVLGTDVKNIKVFLDKQKFCLVYASFWDLIFETQLSRSDLELLSYLTRYYANNTIFSISKVLRMEVAKKFKRSPESYKNSVRQLLEAGFIFKYGSARTYKLNPKLAFEGNSKNRRKAVIEMLNCCPEC